MRVVKKVASFVALVVSALLFLAFLASVAGVWVVRGQVLQIGSDAAAMADQALVRGQDVTSRLSSRLDTTQARVSTGVTMIEAVGTKVEQTPVVLNLVEQLINKDLSPAIDNLKDQVTNVRDTLALADQVITLMQRLPGSRANDSRLVTAADAAIERMKTADQQAQAANQALLDAKTNAVGNVVERLTTPLKNVGAGLQEVQTSVQEVNSRLSQAQVRVQEALNQFNMIVTGIVVGLTFLFLWLALSQVALFIWAYRGATGRDLLARKPESETTTAAVA